MSDPRSPERRRAVLVIDDDRELAETLASALSGEFHMMVACSGREALAAIRERRFHAIICDVNMPGMAGDEVFERAGIDDPRVRERFIFMTGGIFEPRMLDAIERSGRPCLEKPISLFDLRDRVRSMT